MLILPIVIIAKIWSNQDVLKQVSEVNMTQSYPTLCDPMNYSLPGSSVHGILQARILEWVTVPFSKEPSQPRDQIQVSHIAGTFFTIWATAEALQ